jgi:hypothetical protein
MLLLYNIVANRRHPSYDSAPQALLYALSGIILPNLAKFCGIVKNGKKI